MLGIQPLNTRSHLGRIQACGIDDFLRQQFSTVFGAQQDAIGLHLACHHRREQGQRAASLLHIALQCQHQPMAVHNAGAG